MTRRSVQKSDSRYQELRQRNNQSVQKSREKSRRERDETLQSIKSLEEENDDLAKNLQLIKDEYEQLRDLFKQHTGMDIEQTGSPARIPEPALPPPPKPVLNIQTTDETTADEKSKLDAENLDGSIVVINGVQYKIVSMNK